jgi:hypothetical protein
MGDYDPDFVFMIPIEYKRKEIFYEHIKVPGRIRGALLIDEEKKNVVDFQIFSPSGKLIYQNTTFQCIFDFEVYEIGDYQIIFDNRYVNTEIRVTFTLNGGQEKILKKEDLSFVDQKIEGLLGFLDKWTKDNKVLKSSTGYERKKSIIIINY